MFTLVWVYLLVDASESGRVCWSKAVPLLGAALLSDAAVLVLILK